jgi:hypothetical protein
LYKNKKMNLDTITLLPEEIRKVLIRGIKTVGSTDTDRRLLIEDWDCRDRFKKTTSWHIPSGELIRTLVKLGPIVSVGAGYGYTESLALVLGADLIATDINPTSSNSWCRGGKYYCKVEELDAADAVRRWPDRNVFLAWPPYDTPMAYEVANAMSPGQLLIYVGESAGGCTGDDSFFSMLHSEFEEIEEILIASWSGLHDNCTVYKKLDKK